MFNSDGDHAEFSVAALREVGAELRNSDHPDRRNRRMAIAETGAWRSPKPAMAITETGHPDHRNR